MITCFVFCLLILGYHCDKIPNVATPLGKILGHIKSSHQGRTFSAFEGIPFAQPPIGDKRFEEPEPIQPWTGSWNATTLIECAQSTVFQPGKVQGDEDCLYLNVYVPGENPNPEANLDVIVDIHGGAYMYASGHAYAKPTYIMDRDLIFVTINYRLGILGFLSTEDEVVPGNNGLKDQSLALRWVRNNIASFGGNPDSVTITGMSAGGSSVHFHYFSELSRGLFHRGLSQSGVALNPWSLQDEPLSKTKRLADAVGCPSTNTRTMVDCLKQRPYQHLLDQVKLYLGYSFLPFAPFAPVVEKAGSRPFLRENPYKLLIEGKVQDVPWITANTAHEGALTTSHFSNNNDLEVLNANWYEWAPFLLEFNYTLPKSSWKSTIEKITEFYLGEDHNINQDNFLKLTQMFGDRIFLVDAENAVRLQAKATKSPIYYYYFNYPGDNSEDNLIPHGAEIKYLFGSFMNSDPLSTAELQMTDLFLDMLASYTKTGVPTFGSTNWEPTSYDKLTYLNISGTRPEDVTLQTIEELTPRSFWRSLGLRENENFNLVKDEL